MKRTLFRLLGETLDIFYACTRSARFAKMSAEAVPRPTELFVPIHSLIYTPQKYLIQVKIRLKRRVLCKIFFKLISSRYLAFIIQFGVGFIQIYELRLLNRLRSEERRVGKECRSRWS